MNQPKVSIITPIYNGEKYLPESIESALGQTYVNLELILINDCSTDNSEAIAKKYLTDPRVIYIRNDSNIGVAASRNSGIARSTGELIAFLDQDDIWLPEKLRIQVAAMDRHPEIGLLHARLAPIDGQGNMPSRYAQLDRSHFENPAAETEIGQKFNDLFISNNIQPLTTVIRKGVFDEVGYFNESLPGVDDYELWLRIARRYPVGEVQTILAYYRFHDTQQSKDGYKMLLIRLQALNTILANDPGAAVLVDRQAFIKRMHALNRGVANYYLYKQQDYRTARPYFREALRYKPLDANSIIKLIYCSLPEGSRNVLRRAKNLVREANSKNVS